MPAVAASFSPSDFLQNLKMLSVATFDVSLRLGTAAGQAAWLSAALSVTTS